MRHDPVPALDRDDVNQLVVRWQQHHDRRARDELVERFLPLARKLAVRYLNPTEPLEDLVQVAALGLLGAVDRFDPAHGTSFTSFAVPTILGQIKRHFRDTGWALHVPRGAQELAIRVETASSRLTARTGRPPRLHELADHLQLEPAEVLLGLEARAAHYANSLDAPVAGVDGAEPQTLGETIGAPDARLSLVETTATLSAAIGQLPEQQRRALAMRVSRDMTQAEIGQDLGCSQMQVSRLLHRAAGTLQTQ